MLRSRLLWKIYLGYFVLIVLTASILGGLIFRRIREDSLEDIQTSLRSQALFFREFAARRPADEPASELVKRIAAEKVRLVKAGEIGKQKPMARPKEAQQAFDLPSSWFLTKLGLVAVCLDYMRKPVNGTERKRRIAGKPTSQLFPYFGATQQQGWIDEYIFDEELVLLGEDGVPFFDSLRPKAYLIAGKSWVNNHAHVFRGVLVSNAYLVHYLNVFDYSGRVVGATRSKLNQAKALEIPVMLPPLAACGVIHM